MLLLSGPTLALTQSYASIRTTRSFSRANCQNRQELNELKLVHLKLLVSSLLKPQQAGEKTIETKAHFTFLSRWNALVTKRYGRASRLGETPYCLDAPITEASTTLHRICRLILRGSAVPGPAILANREAFIPLMDAGKFATKPSGLGNKSKTHIISYFIKRVPLKKRTLIIGGYFLAGKLYEKLYKSSKHAAEEQSIRKISDTYM
ncbi:hypothetical protein CSKR_103038, partial [Clonorchis sinensis]